MGAGDHTVAEDIAPAPEALVAGEYRRLAFVAAADAPQEERGRLAVDGQVAKFVDDQQPGQRVDHERVVEAALAQRLGEGGKHLSGCREKHAVAVLDGLEAERYREVGLPYAGRSHHLAEWSSGDDVGAHGFLRGRRGTARLDPALPRGLRGVPTGCEG